MTFKNYLAIKQITYEENEYLVGEWRNYEFLKSTLKNAKKRETSLVY